MVQNFEPQNLQSRKKKKKKNTFLLRTSIFQENATHSYNQSARFIYCFFFHEIFVNFSIFFLFSIFSTFFGLNMDKLKKKSKTKTKEKTNKQTNFIIFVNFSKFVFVLFFFFDI